MTSEYIPLGADKQQASVSDLASATQELIDLAYSLGHDDDAVSVAVREILTANGVTFE